MQDRLKVSTFNNLPLNPLIQPLLFGKTTELVSTSPLPVVSIILMIFGLPSGVTFYLKNIKFYNK